MNNELLPDYKRKFLQEMELLRQQQLSEKQAEKNTSVFQRSQQRPTPQNNILNTSMYSSKDWRKQLTTTSYNANHNMSNFDLNLLLNPELKKKQHNLGHTALSQYSNAVHNNNVFINPRFSAC